MTVDSQPIVFKPRPDQRELINFICEKCDIPLATLMRWIVDCGRASLLERVSMTEADLPDTARRPT